MAAITTQIDRANRQLADLADYTGLQIRLVRQPHSSAYYMLIVTDPATFTAAQATLRIDTDMNELHAIAMRAVRVVHEQAKRNAAPKPNELDMRRNNIESVNDYLTLLNRSKHDMKPIDTVIVTPEQYRTVLADTAATFPTAVTGNRVQLFGCYLKAEPL